MNVDQYTSEDVIRFWSKVNKNASIPTHCPELGQCWEWIASCSKKGYGQIGIQGKVLRTHRFVWEITNGGIPDELQVLHKCDNRKCVNPNHLFLGTNTDNVRDKVIKSRQSKMIGEKNPCRKLSWEQISDMRSRFSRNEIRAKDLIKEYGMSPSQISKILNEKSWKP